jgi:hypothetical protein
LFLLATLTAPQLAEAASCVHIDESHDALTPAERTSAIAMVSDELRAGGRQVSDPPCDETFELLHARFGESVIVSLTGPTGSQRMKADRVEDLPSVYSRIVPALLEGKSTDATITRDSVTSGEADTKRVNADTLATARVGIGGFAGSYDLLSLGGGSRWELDRVAIDLSGDLLLDVNDQENFAGLLGIGAYYIPGGEKNASPYLGLRLGLGFQAAEGLGGGFGFEPALSGGYMFLRSSTIRVFGQADVGLPTWTLSESGDWRPSLGLSVGIGFHPPKKVD